MSDEMQEETGGQQDTEAQAREIGWLPQEEFKGPAEKWKPADAYLRDGETFIPYLRADRKRLLGTNRELNSRVSALEAGLRASNALVEELHNGATAEEKAELEGQIKTLRRQLAEARQGGDIEAEIAIEEQLDAAKAKVTEVEEKAKEKKPAVVAPPGPDPHMQKFMRENEWFGKDEFKTAAAVSFIPILQKDPNYASWTPDERYVRLAQEIDKRFGGRTEETRQPISKTEGGSRGPSGTTRGRNYDSLPAEAKAICDRQAAKLVNPEKKFKTVADYRAYYVEHFDWS
jgi:hypothetical protein